MDMKLAARIGAATFVALAITATAIEASRKEEAPARAFAPAVVQTDPLRVELARCQLLGEGGARDPACLRAWAENRRRFLAPGSRPMERMPDPSADAVPAADASLTEQD
jgi:conjugative transfer region protein TrbK